jgi:hypothetical protein
LTPWLPPEGFRSQGSSDPAGIHVLTTPAGEYGTVDPDLDHRDARRVRLDQLVEDPGDRIR